jgi:hypothetical protein
MIPVSRLLVCLALMLIAASASARARSNAHTRLKTPNGNEQLALADLNGDGKKEFIGWTQEYTGFEISVMSADSPWQQMARLDVRGNSAYFGHYIKSFFTGYFDSTTQESICFYTQNPNNYGYIPRVFCFMLSYGSLVETSSYTAPPEWMIDSKYAVGDFDGNGYDEVLIYRQNGRDLHVLKYNQRFPNYTTYGFSRMASFDYGNLAGFDWTGGVEFHVGNIVDYPNEGRRDDLLVFNVSTRQIARYDSRLYNGMTTFWWAYTSASVVGGNEEVMVAEANGDGLEDLILHDIWYGNTRFLNAADYTLPALKGGRLGSRLSSGNIPRFSTPTENYLFFGILSRASAEPTYENLRDDALVYIPGERNYLRYDNAWESASCAPYQPCYTGTQTWWWNHTMPIDWMQGQMGITRW